MHEEPRKNEAQAPAQEGPEKDPRSADQPRRQEGRQGPLVHEGAEADPKADTNEDADAKVDVVQPDGGPVPEPSD